MAGDRTAVVWYRRDLRLHDHEPLVDAANADELLAVFVFDPREYGTARFGGRHSFSYEKTGPYRTRFRLEAVSDLRTRLRDAGSDLVVRVGSPEDVVAELAADVDADTVYAHTWPTAEERSVETALADRLAERDVDFERTWGHTLSRPADLPTPIEEIDDTYTPFRKAVEADGLIGDPLPQPSLPPSPAVDPGRIPTATELGVELATPDDRAVLGFEGGETAGFERLETYLWETDSLREYKETRNGLLGRDYSSKLSPWLNEGCLSPREVYAEVKAYEQRRVSNQSTYWLVFELRWRDFFQFQFAKHGTRFFTPGGIRQRTIEWRGDCTAFERWNRGETGIPFVDANVRELNATGYLSNRGRQNVASFLVNDLEVDWRLGAAYFETQLVDYDVASNYGNWAYIAGVGNDSRDRAFDVLWQAKRYDPDAEYVTRWLPELSALPAEFVHEPWRLSPAQQAEYGVTLGVDYPEPILRPGR